MKSSGSSSATETTPATSARRSADRARTETATDAPGATTNAPTRERFALTGPSVLLDPRRHAVRRDLADVRLADRVFAPHYAAPLPRLLTRPAPLNSEREPGSELLGELEAGERFEVLELTDGQAWGVAPGRGLVGYVDAGSLSSA